MADYHTVYKGPEGETTEWEDLQVKHGNLAPREPAWKPEAYAPGDDAVGPAPKDAAWVDAKREDELSDLEDELADDRFLEQYRCVGRARVFGGSAAGALSPRSVAGSGRRADPRRAPSYVFGHRAPRRG